MPIRDQHPDIVDPHLEDLRKGTRKQYTSGWEFMHDNTSVSHIKSFTHGLGEVPWMVDVIVSEESSGKNAAQAVLDTGAADYITFTKTDTVITVTSEYTTDQYFQVRAM